MSNQSLLKIENGVLIRCEDYVTREVVIPNDVTSIGDFAFDACSSLTSIVIPDSVTSLGDNAFRGCRSLTSVIIPDSVTSIGERAFEYCSSLTSVVIPDSVTSIGFCAFAGCLNLTDIVIPDSVTSIGDNAFAFCNSLKSVTIGNSVTTIDGGAFRNCSSLTDVTIGNGVTSIGEYAFENCSSLTNVTLSKNITDISVRAFCGSYNLKTSPKNYKAVKIQKGKFICRNVEYKLNKWSTEINNIVICEKGYHYCTNLFEIFNYYCGEIDKDIAIFECEVGDKVITSNTSKCCTNKIKLIKRLYREDVIKILNGEDKEIEDETK